MSLSGRWTAVLDDLRGQNRYRSLRVAAGIDFTSNDYLGYGGKNLTPPTPLPEAGRGERIPAAFLDSSPPSRFGKGAGGLGSSLSTSLPITGASSRLLRGHHALWDEVESALAAWHGAEAVLMMTSGYTANEGLLSTVIEPGDWVAADELVHASIIDGLRLARPQKFRFRHNDLNHLEDGLRAAAQRSHGERFVVTESLFSMDGDLAPLAAVADLAERYGAKVIVDEAHSTGCYGPGGAGCVDAVGLRGRVLATVHTGGKALGVTGAYICGSQILKEYLVNKCRHLIFTTALPPAVARWWLDVPTRVSKDDDGRRRLHDNAAAFRSSLAAHDVPVAGTEYVVPVFLGDDGRALAAAIRLQEQGFDVRAIRPPSVPPGTARLRISIHADHEPATLARLAAAVAEAVRP
jgi:8-amino-7-oxononanoate synthase